MDTFAPLTVAYLAVFGFVRGFTLARRLLWSS
jgi:hypothetical protein